MEVTYIVLKEMFIFHSFKFFPEALKFGTAFKLYFITRIYLSEKNQAELQV